MKKQQQKKSRMMMVGALVVLGLGCLAAVFGMSKAVESVDGELISREPEAILASAGVVDESTVDLPVAYFDQRADKCVNMYDKKSDKDLAKRQFEWTSCKYSYKQMEQGLVEYNLSEDYLPVAVGGNLTTNRGLTNMDRWFESTEGKSKEYPGTLKLAYKSSEGSEFSFVSNDFYPLDEAEFSAGDSVNKDGHNHLFTMSFAMPFMVMASGNESFEIAADDDTFVFVGTELAIDMGGIHDATKGKLAINEAGEVYTAIENEELAYSGIKLEKGQSSIIRIFHADRDSDSSVLKVRLANINLNVVQTKVADANGVQVAYDPTDPGHVAPLGESVVLRPDGTRGFVILATILGVVIVTCAIFASIMAHALIKSHKND